MALNTWVAGDPAAMRGYAEQVHLLGTNTERVATGQHQVRTAAAAAWEGQASEAFQRWATEQAGGGDTLAELFVATARAVEAWSDEIDTVRARMEQAKQVAAEGRLMVLGDLIHPPAAARPEPTGMPSAELPRTAAEAEAARARRAAQESAFAEARATVEQARGLERAAHEKLVHALNEAKDALQGLPQGAEWAQAGAHPTNPAGAALAHAATAVEGRAADATRGMFEQAMTQGPAAVHGCWSSLSTAQRADLIDRFPQLVGSADGVPTTARDQANMALLAGQRRELEAKQRSVRNHIAGIRPGEGMAAEKQRLESQAAEIEQALSGLRELEEKVRHPDYYLLGIDSTASGGRGQAIIANGNPDTAQNVVTTVPGTYSDLGDVMDYVDRGDEVMRRAQDLGANESVASITYAGYESPPSLADAADGEYAEDGSLGLSRFQEGLRASHQLEQPSNNTIIGHSYGSTQVGYAARDHGVHADNIIFIGSPGVGVDHASELGAAPGHVWSGTSSLDIIEYATPSPNPLDYHDPFDDHWFGRDPSDPSFGARELPVRDQSYHSDYWKYDESLDGMARVVAGGVGSSAANEQGGD
ncbi:alpha/beta hydrolase [Saccharopolyspora cebuensis]|uniref:Alpha/beta hydrolase n=1 Tax=Saccharopolyspora cebuensis TaxID=418759 RepID=A0ABV4CIN6_9PSEU